MSTRIRLARPALDGAELSSVQAVLDSGMLIQGAHVARFETAVAERIGRAHAIAVGSGTSALILAMRALDLTGSEVLVPALTWPSPAHAITLLGGRARLADVCPRTWNATDATLRGARSERTRAIVAIDQFGVPADHPAIAALGLPVIEDAACAIGSLLAGRSAGSFGAIATLSFHPRKILTTGEGGMCLTDDTDLAARLRRLRNHGQDAPGRFTEASGNDRMTELAAAIGLAQLAKLDGILARRRAIAARYREVLAGLPLRVQEPTAGSAPNEQTFGALLDPGVDRAGVIAFADREGVELGLLSYDLTQLPSLPGPHLACPTTASIVARGLALPLHTALTDDDVERVLGVLGRALEQASAGREVRA